MSFNGKKTAFLFPGQGAQYVGMAMDFIQADSSLRQALNAFKEREGQDLYAVMAEGPEESLKQTHFTQPAILLHGIAALKALKKELEIEPDFVAGHSLGEFTALAASGVFSLDDAMHLVYKRGQFMIRANDGRPFAMAAVLGLAPADVKALCEEASGTDLVIAANFNTPEQTVISGSEAGVARASELAKERGAKRVVPLMVGGPFHTPMIARASEWLAKEIATINIHETAIPVVSNVDARPTADLEVIRKNLALQVTSPVLWVDCVKFMIDSGVELFIEFGPQKVLAGMMRKIDRKANIVSIDKMDDVAPAVEKIRAMAETEGCV